MKINNKKKKRCTSPPSFYITGYPTLFSFGYILNAYTVYLYPIYITHSALYYIRKYIGYRLGIYFIFMLI